MISDGRHKNRRRKEKKIRQKVDGRLHYDPINLQRIPTLPWASRSTEASLYLHTNTLM